MTPLESAREEVARMEAECRRAEKDYWQVAYAALDVPAEQFSNAIVIRDAAARTAEEARLQLWNARMKMFRLKHDAMVVHKVGEARR